VIVAVVVGTAVVVVAVVAVVFVGVVGVVATMLGVVTEIDGAA
jgi:hypothetical protein